MAVASGGSQAAFSCRIWMRRIGGPLWIDRLHRRLVYWVGAIGGRKEKSSATWRGDRGKLCRALAGKENRIGRVRCGLLLSRGRAPYNAPPDGEVPERSIGAVSKTVVPLAGTQGSNPCLSATHRKHCYINNLQPRLIKILTNNNA